MNIENVRKSLDVQHRGYAYHVKGTHIAVDMKTETDDYVLTRSRSSTRIEDTEFYQLLIPLLVWMKLFGVFFSDGRRTTTATTMSSKKLSKFIRRRQPFNKPVSFIETIWRLFSRYAKQWSSFLCCFMWVLILLTIGLYFVSESEFSLETIFFLLFLLFILIMVSIGGVVFYRFNSTGMMLLLFQKYSRLQTSSSAKKVLARNISKACIIVTTFFIAGTGINVIGWSFVLYTTYEEKSQIFVISIFLEMFPFPINRIFFFSLFVISFFIINMLSLQPAFIVLINIIMFIILKQFNEELMMDDHSHNDGLHHTHTHWTELRISLLHSKYQRIVEMIETFDTAIGFYIISFVLLLMIVLCLLTYFMLFFCVDDFIKGVLISWVLLSVTLGLSLLMSAAMMNAMAMKSVTTLHEMDISLLPSNSVMKFLVLMNSVSRSIGITAMGFFTITQSYVISLSATFFSYFFVLIEFSPSARMCKASNSTDEFE